MNNPNLNPPTFQFETLDASSRVLTIGAPDQGR